MKNRRKKSVSYAAEMNTENRPILIALIIL